MHPGAVFDVQTPGQSPAASDPADPPGPPRACGTIGQFPPEAALEDLPERRAGLRRPLLRLDQQRVRQVDSGLHMEKNITINMGNSLNASPVAFVQFFESSAVQ